MDFIKRYTELFAGAPSRYAILREWMEDGEPRKSYFPSDYTGPKDTTKSIVDQIVSDIGTSEWNEVSAKAHLQGKHFLGVYPIHPDSTVKFFALDFDNDEPVAREEARRQQLIFKNEAGLATYVERSRSGNGYHLWGFLEAPFHAGELRFALEPYIEKTDTYDRMFPNQDGATEVRPYGNLIALPLFGPNVKKGTGVFLEFDTNGTAVEIDDQKQYLMDINRIPTGKMRELFGRRTDLYVPDLGGRKRKGDPEGLSGIYKVVHKDLGCEWVRWCIENPSLVKEPEWYALACQFAQLDGGRDMFHKASENDPRYTVKATDEKFDQALAKNAPHTHKYIQENLNGPKCTCEERFPKHQLKHPYDLAKVPFYDMVEQLRLENDPQPAATGLQETITTVKATYKDPTLFQGWAYGIPDLDKFTELRPNDLILVLARPGRGKTAFMVDVAFRLASQGVPVYVFSMEMSAQQFWKRLLSRGAQVDGKRLDKGTLGYSEWRRILKFGKELESGSLPIFVDDSTYDATEVVNKAAELIAEHGPGVVMVDYAQMATNQPGESDYSKNSRVPRQYKLLAKGMHVPVLSLVQMNREGEDLTEDSETLDTVAEGSGKLEQYADVMLYILGLRRPGIVRRTVVIHKERHREAGHKIKLDFNQPVMTFQAEGFWATRAQQINYRTQISGKDFFA